MLIVLVAINLGILAPMAIQATSVKAAQAPSRRSAPSASFPLHVVAAAAPLNATQVTVTVTISTSVALSSDVALSTTFAPELQIVASTLPAHDSIAVGAPKTYTFVVQSSTTTPGRLDVRASATANNEPISDLTVLFLAQRNNALAQIPEPEALRILEAQKPQVPQPADTLAVADTMIVADAPAAAPQSQVDPSAAPASNPPVAAAPAAGINITVKGGFEYWDHPVAPRSASPRGVSPTGIRRKIRKAQVTVLTLLGTQWYRAAPVSYTDGSGAFSQSINGFTGAKVKVQVCTIGPDSTNRVRLTTSALNDNLPVCFTTSQKDPATTVDFGTAKAEDTRAGSSPWNIYQVALETWEYINGTVGAPTQNLIVYWFIGYNPPFSGDGSYYNAGRVNLNGTTESGDQWNDSVIAHEIGHWFMDVYYGGYPPDADGTHGRCNEGRPNMQYAEGWATFFTVASRSSSYNQANKTYATWYIDAPDDSPNGIGTIEANRIIQQDIETPINFDTTETEDFRTGNFCEW